MLCAIPSGGSLIPEKKLGVFKKKKILYNHAVV